MNLPPEAKRKLASLDASADDAESLAQSAKAGALAAQRRLPALLNMRDSDPARAAEIDPEIADLEGEMERLRALARARSDVATGFRQTVVRVRAWLATLPPSTVFEAVRSPSRVASAAGRAGVAEVRREIEKLKGDLADVEVAPLPASELKAAAQALIEEAAERARPIVRTEGGGFRVLWPRATGDDPGETPKDMLGLAAVVFPDALLSVIGAEIDRACAASPIEGLTAAERAKRRAELREAILDAERREEALIEDTPDVARRPDASPLAILGVRSLPPSAARAA
jgi:hypothetical protein